MALNKLGKINYFPFYMMIFGFIVGLIVGGLVW